MGFIPAFVLFPFVFLKNHHLSYILSLAPVPPGPPSQPSAPPPWCALSGHVTFLGGRSLFLPDVPIARQSPLFFQMCLPAWLPVAWWCSPPRVRWIHRTATIPTPSPLQALYPREGHLTQPRTSGSWEWSHRPPPRNTRTQASPRSPWVAFLQCSTKNIGGRGEDGEGEDANVPCSLV